MSEPIIPVGGASVSRWIAPWVEWLVEKRRVRFSRRSELIESWRTALEANEADTHDLPSGYLSSAAYSSLRPHLHPDVRTKVEALRTLYVGGGRGEAVLREMLLDEVARLEKKWGLV